MPIIRSSIRVCVLSPPMVCSAWLLVVGGQVQGSRVCVQEEGCCTTASCNIPKHVELIGIVNKPLLLHLVSCLYYCTIQR